MHSAPSIPCKELGGVGILKYFDLIFDRFLTRLRYTQYIFLSGKSLS
jgi:hypothetical protein